MTKPLQYTCQFCGKDSPAKAWKQQHDHCPKCKRLYDWMIAQDSEDD